MERASDTPKCVAIFDQPGGIKTSEELQAGLSAMMGDLAAERMTTGRGNAISNAAGKMLKNVELAYKYGRKDSAALIPVLRLAAPASDGAAPNLPAVPA